MNDTFAHGLRPGNFEDEVPEAPFKSLTRDEARALRARIPSISPWWVVAAQAAAGLACCLIVWVFARQGSAVWSALYGAAAVVLPSALLARGMTRSERPNPVAAVIGFMLWEGLKIGTAVAMLVIAARVVPNLSWPALLVTMVVCIKLNWVALLWRARAVDDKASHEHGS